MAQTSPTDAHKEIRRRRAARARGTGAQHAHPLRVARIDKVPKEYTTHADPWCTWERVEEWGLRSAGPSSATSMEVHMGVLAVPHTRPARVVALVVMQLLVELDVSDEVTLDLGVPRHQSQPRRL